MKKFYDEFPEIAIPELLQGEGWSDTSWHNDATACSTKTIIDPYDIIVWVWDDDVEQRECKEASKYQVNIYDDGSYIDDVYFDANTEEELVVAIEKAMDALQEYIEEQHELQLR